MKYLRYVVCAMNMITISFATPVTAAPSPGIDKLLSTPASTFDVFLHQIYVASNGPAFFGGPNMNEALRIFDLDYDYDSNLISLKFRISIEHKLMKGFAGGSSGSKKEILLRAAKNLAESLGIAPRDGILRFGLLQALHIRNGWHTKDFNEERIKNELADRTVVDLVYAGEEKQLYKARRLQNGKYEFLVDMK